MYQNNCVLLLKIVTFWFSYSLLIRSDSQVAMRSLFGIRQFSYVHPGQANQIYGYSNFGDNNPSSDRLVVESNSKKKAIDSVLLKTHSKNNSKQHRDHDPISSNISSHVSGIHDSRVSPTKSPQSMKTSVDGLLVHSPSTQFSPSTTPSITITTTTTTTTSTTATTNATNHRHSTDIVNNQIHLESSLPKSSPIDTRIGAANNNGSQLGQEIGQWFSLTWPGLEVGVSKFP